MRDEFQRERLSEEMNFGGDYQRRLSEEIIREDEFQRNFSEKLREIITQPTQLSIQIIKKGLSIVIANLLSMPGSVIPGKKAEGGDFGSVEELAHGRSFQAVHTGKCNLLVILEKVFCRNIQ